MNQYYGIGAGFSRTFGTILAVGVIGGLTFIEPRKEGRVQPPGRAQVPAQVESNLQTHNKIILNHAPRLTSLRWIKSLLYYKNGQEEYSNDQAAVISVLAVGYSMLGKKILRMSPPSVQKFDLEDTVKLVAIVAASEMTRGCLINQKILPDGP